MSGIEATVETAVYMDDLEAAEGFYELLTVASEYGVEVRPPEPG